MSQAVRITKKCSISCISIHGHMSANPVIAWHQCIPALPKKEIQPLGANVDELLNGGVEVAAASTSWTCNHLHPRMIGTAPTKTTASECTRKYDTHILDQMTCHTNFSKHSHANERWDGPILSGWVGQVVRNQPFFGKTFSLLKLD
jgi:uncharacterized protein YgiB involved in biofilm formation